ncbi:nucleolin-like [Centruroides sculpturatus]|uniref:nucleolin-like n=1 Tax=Centruroides sculpturatus TaxID=218467 RepID=UPI000C6E5F09|nr:nucleolin-like [Centruroides sculpturatus]
MIPRQQVTLKLVEGSGPVSIFGHHVTVFPDYSDDDDDDYDDEEDEEEEQNEEKEDEIKMKTKKVSLVDVSEKLPKKRKVSKSDGLPKKDDDDADNESEEDDADYEQESSPEKPKKRIDTPSKKMIKSTPSKNKDKKVSFYFLVFLVSNINS